MGGSAQWRSLMVKGRGTVNKLASRPYVYDLCEDSKYIRNIVGPQVIVQLFSMIATPLLCPFTPLVCSNYFKIHYLYI